jgi:hypothetical protein
MLISSPKLKVMAIYQRYGITLHDYLFNYLWKNHAIRIDPYPVEAIRQSDIQNYDLILNVICNSLSTKWLKRIEEWSAEKNIPVLNNAQSLINCGRKEAADLWTENNVGCGRVERIPTRNALLKSEINYPIITRNAFSHLGATMVLTHSREDVNKLPDETFQKGAVAIEFFDYRNDDGFYRKYRAILMGRRIIPRHIISSPEWNIHSDSRQSERMDEHRKEEYEFWNRELYEGSELLRAKEVLGLDYTIADYTLDKEGKPFFFEMNPCFSIVDPRAFKREWAYQLDPIHRYCEAFAGFLYSGFEQYISNYRTVPIVL